MNDITREINELRAELGENTQLVAVSKFHPVDKILVAYDAGQRIFGESRVQELNDKALSLPKDIKWHFIGTLQRNKVKYIVPYIDTIHSIDRPDILHEIETQALKIGGREDWKIKLLLQVHISNEETKHGFSEEELIRFLDNLDQSSLKCTQICGLMGMAALTDNVTIIRSQFKSLSQLFKRVQDCYFPNDNYFNELSMGMSQDYKLAIEEGSTMVRIGSRIFGSREY